MTAVTVTGLGVVVMALMAAVIFTIFVAAASARRKIEMNVQSHPEPQP